MTNAVPASSTQPVPGHTPITVRMVQIHIGATLEGNAETVLTGVNSVELAQPGELAFAESDKYRTQVHGSRAAAIIVPTAFPKAAGRTLLRVEQPRVAFAKAMYLFQPKTTLCRGIHRDAVVAPDVTLAEGVTIAECAVVRPGARIGRDTVIESGVHIGERVSIGERCVIGPNVVIRHGCHIGDRVIVHGGTVIGADGFGYVWTDARYLKIPQVGNVIIEDDVELGANVCVDRATMGSTIIRRGTKIDNLVQIAHNDVIGEDVSISGQVGLAGSVHVGNRVVIGGQVGVADHLTIGDDARIGAGSGVIKNVRPGETVWWSPARPIERVKKAPAPRRKKRR